MGSIWDRVGTALKAGASGAADSLLKPGANSGTPSGQGAPVVYAMQAAASDEGWKKWILPGAALALGTVVVLKIVGSKPSR